MNRCLIKLTPHRWNMICHATNLSVNVLNLLLNTWPILITKNQGGRSDDGRGKNSGFFWGKRLNIKNSETKTSGPDFICFRPSHRYSPLGLLYRNQQPAAAVSRIYTVSQGDGNFTHFTANWFLLPCHYDASAGFWQSAGKSQNHLLSVSLKYRYKNKNVPNGTFLF